MLRKELAVHCFPLLAIAVFSLELNCNCLHDIIGYIISIPIGLLYTLQPGTLKGSYVWELLLVQVLLDHSRT